MAGTYAVALVASYVVRGAVAPAIPPDVHVITLKGVSGQQRTPQPVRLAYREYRGSGGGTPVLLLDPSIVVRQYTRLRDALPFVRFHYAVKACAHSAVIAALAEEGCDFDKIIERKSLSVISQG